MRIELETQSFSMSSRVFINPNHTLYTLNHDLFGTCASNKPVKTIRAQKADREGQSFMVVADALFGIVLSIRFECRAESQRRNGNRLMYGLMEGRGEYFLSGIVVSMDGYAQQIL